MLACVLPGLLNCLGCWVAFGAVFHLVLSFNILPWVLCALGTGLPLDAIL